MIREFYMLESDLLLNFSSSFFQSRPLPSAFEERKKERKKRKKSA